MYWHSPILWAYCTIIGWFITILSVSSNALECNFDTLRPGQYRCPAPQLDPQTSQVINCSDNFVEVICELDPALKCTNSFVTIKEYADGTREETVNFRKQLPCSGRKATKKHTTALILSIFLGWLGIDRFYLGYPFLGLFKLFTFGFMLTFYLLDIILIALQIVGPADGSPYIIDQFGPHTHRIVLNNETYIHQQF